MQYRSQVRKVGAELSCVDGVLDTDHRYALMLDVFFIALFAQRSTIMSISLLGQRSTVMSKCTWYKHMCFMHIIEEERRVKLYVKFSLFILLFACDRSTHRKLIRGTSYQAPLKGSLIIEKICTGVHGIRSIWRKNVYLSAPPPSPHLFNSSH